MPEKKTLNEDLFYKGSSANLPRLHTCKNKVPFWDFSQFAVTIFSYKKNTVDFSKCFDSIHRRKMEQILLPYALPKETLIAKMMLYKDIKAMVHSLDSDWFLWHQRDTFALFLFIICRDYMPWTSINQINEMVSHWRRQEADENPQKLLLMQTMQMILSFFQIQLPQPNLCWIAWSRQQVALVSTWTQIKQSLRILMKMVPSPLKLVHQITLIVCNNSSTESDISICLGKGYQQYEIKQKFFQAVTMSALLHGCTTWTLIKCFEKKLDGNHIRMLHVILNKFGKQLYSHLLPILQTIKVRWTRHVEHCWRSKNELISDVLLWVSDTWTYLHWLNCKNLCSLALCRHWITSKWLAKDDGQYRQMVRERQKEGNLCFDGDDNHTMLQKLHIVRRLSLTQ